MGAMECSVVDAVRAAVEVQRGMATRNAECRTTSNRVPHGHQLGELIIDGRDFWAMP
jgi:hypothetical protein